MTGVQRVGILVVSDEFEGIEYVMRIASLKNCFLEKEGYWCADHIPHKKRSREGKKN
ncbi:MAG: hypothetical protein QXW47_09785 [Candidatus Jordarchaeales archaeon]